NEWAAHHGGGIDAFFFEADLDERLREILNRGACGNLDVITQPVQWYVWHLALTSQGETDVAFDHVVHVVDSVAKHECAFDPHAKSKTGVFLGIYAARDEHIWVDHAATTPFNPPGSALLLREPQIHLGARFSEREKAWAQSGLCLRAKH